MCTTRNYFTHKSKYLSYAAHTDALQPSQHADSSDDDDDEQLTPTAASASAAASVPWAPAAADTPLRCCELCLLAPIEGFALVPCGNCENCARRVADEGGTVQSCNQHGDARFCIYRPKIAVVNSNQLGLDICDWNWNCNINYNTGTHDVLWSLYDFFCLSHFW